MQSFVSGLSMCGFVLLLQDILVRSKAQENDETYYMWAMRFFMEFNRKHEFRADFIGWV